MKSEKVDLLIIIVTWICIATMVILSATILLNCITSHKKRIEYLRSYKRGKFTFAFVPFYFLCLVGLYYSGGNRIVFMDSLNALKRTIEMIGLRYENLENIILANDFSLYKCAVIYSYVLITANALLFSWAVLQQRMNYWFYDLIRKKNKWRIVPMLKKNLCFIYGKNNNSQIIYKSAEKEGYKHCYIIDSFPIDGDTELFSSKYRYSSCNNLESEKAFVRRILRERIYPKQLNKFFPDKRHLTMIINFADNDLNIKFCKMLIEVINESIEPHLNTSNVHPYNRISIVVLGDENLSSIYHEIENASHGCIRYTNKYRLISTQFVINHPFTAYMNKNHIDYKEASIKPRVNASIVMIGFGKTSRRIFTDLVADNQFIQKSEHGEDKAFQAKYYLFDCKNNVFTKDLNHDFLRYNRFFDDNPNNPDYLPLPEKPALVYPFEENDINCPEFYKNLRLSLLGSKNKSEETDFSYIIVSFGTDLENIEFAKKIKRKIEEWKILNCLIFVKVEKNGNCFSFLKKRSDLKNSGKISDDESLIFFGDEKEVFSIKNITLKSYYNLVAAYSNRKSLTVEGYDTKFFSNEWYSKYPYDRSSSFAREMNLKNKLGMINMSFEIRDEETDDGESEQFLKDILNSKVIKEKWNKMEHLRWNAFMICNGYIPSSRKQILRYNPSEKDIIEMRKEEEHMERHHCNLTTHEGLKEYMGMFPDYFADKEKSVILYDDFPFNNLEPAIRASKGRIVLVKKAQRNN